MLSSWVWVSCGELESLTITVKYDVPVDGGVPEIAPVEASSDTPEGSTPVGILQV
jgi:hypothetical protein